MDAANPELLYNALNDEGVRAFEEGKVDQAVVLFERALKYAPGSKGCIRNLAVALWAAREVGRAISVLTRGFLLYPNDRELANELLSAYEAVGDVEFLPPMRAILDRAGQR